MSEKHTIPGLKGRIMEKIVKTLGLQSAIQKLPTELNPTIQPVLNVEAEKEIKIANASFTTSKTKRTFVTGIYIFLIDGETRFLSFKTKNGKNNVFKMDNYISYSFPIAIELLKNSNVVFPITTNGTATNLTYYEVD